MTIPNASNAAGLMFQTWPARTLAPPWMSGPNADRYVSVLQFMSDALLEKATQAVTIHFPGQGNVSQIPYLANDRQLVQGLAESNASFVGRLKGAFKQWSIAGSRLSVANVLQYYLQGLQPGVAAALPLLALVTTNATQTRWDTLSQGAALGASPVRSLVSENWNWDGSYKPWRNWLVLYMSLVAGALSGSSAQTSTAAAGTLYTSGGTASNHVYGQIVTETVGVAQLSVWTPNVTGTAVNHPYMTLTHLAGLSSAQVGQWITVSGSTSPGNNGTFLITSVPSPSTCVIANPYGVTGDTGPLTWSIGTYPFLAPAGVWDQPGTKWDNGALQLPPIDTGSNVQGIWQPTLGGPLPTLAWGLQVQPAVLSPPPPAAAVITSVRALAKQWKSASTWYSEIVVAFDGSTGAAGSTFSPLSAAGSGNPNGTFSGHGTLFVYSLGGIKIGAWLGNRATTSPYDEYCQGTGSWAACLVPNVT